MGIKNFLRISILTFTILVSVPANAWSWRLVDSEIIRPWIGESYIKCTYESRFGEVKYREIKIPMEDICQHYM